MNTTGIEPTEFNVLVRLGRASDRIGGILLPDEKKDRDQAMQTRGVLIAVSPLAFSYDEWRDATPPAVGDSVIIAKGAGVLIDDMGDGEFYRLIKDKDVCAVVRKPDLKAKLAKLDKQIAEVNADV